MPVQHNNNKIYLEKMEKIQSKKSISKVLFLSFLFFFSSYQQQTDIYTIQQAQQCFHNQALAACQDKIHKCVTQKQCQRQLHFYHDCNFQKQYNSQIFNGNCFKNWRKSAAASKQVIQCLDSHCNLAGYNSEVSLEVLYTCSAQSLIQYSTECDQKCQQILEKRVSKNVPYKTIKQIYGTNEGLNKEQQNQNVEKIIEIIRKQCVQEDGSIRKRQQEQNLKKKLSRHKMIDRINEKNKDPEYLNQFNPKDGEKLTPEDL